MLFGFGSGCVFGGEGSDRNLCVLKFEFWSYWVY